VNWALALTTRSKTKPIFASRINEYIGGKVAGPQFFL
jgi:hypothetical protein